MSHYYIYKLCCDDCDEMYVGSTRAFRSRKYQHKASSKTSNRRLYVTIRAFGGFDNWRMVVLEEGESLSLTQAQMKEEEWRLKLNPKLNIRKASLMGRDMKEYQKEYRKQWEIKQDAKRLEYLFKSI